MPRHRWLVIHACSVRLLFVFISFLVEIINNHWQICRIYLRGVCPWSCCLGVGHARTADRLWWVTWSSGRYPRPSTRTTTRTTTTRCLEKFVSHWLLLHNNNKAFIDIRLRPGIATPLEKDRATATGDTHTKFREDWSSGYRDMLADRQTHKLIAILCSPTGTE